MHLDAQTYRHLLGGTLPPEEARALAAHLEGDCEQCEDFLAGLGEADGLDGQVDARLATLAPPAAGAGNDLEFARIERRLRAAPPSPRRRGTPLLALAALLAAAAVAGGIVTTLRPAPAPAAWDGLKGSAAEAVPLRLRFLVLTPAPGGEPRIERGVSGQAVPSAASLQFQVEVGRAAEVALVRVGPGGAAETFFQARLPAGRTEISVAGRPAAYPLVQLAGPQRFLALASEVPIDPADVARAVGLGAGSQAPSGPAITLDVVEVLVRQGP